MHKLLISLIVSLLTFGLLVTDADARRMGGGKSLGFQRPELGRSPPAAAPFRAQPSPAAPARPAPSSRASRWLGPLAGLAAGGLLAALLFGDAFKGLQAFDFILIALIGLGVYFIVRAMRRSSAPQPSRGPMAYAGNTSAAGRTVQAPEIGGGVRGAAPAANRQRPDWFDEQGFLQAAKGHFSRLQAAWDTGNLNEIGEYTTPELFAELSRERRELGDERQYTQVVSLDAELADFVTESDKVIASVRFSGLIREERDGEPQPFNEIWHVERSLYQPSANWYVSGIQQV